MMIQLLADLLYTDAFDTLLSVLRIIVWEE